MNNCDPRVDLASAQERDVYCEVSYNNEPVEFEVVWKLKNNQ